MKIEVQYEIRDLAIEKRMWDVVPMRMAAAGR